MLLGASASFCQRTFTLPAGAAGVVSAKFASAAAGAVTLTASPPPPEIWAGPQTGTPSVPIAESLSVPLQVFASTPPLLPIAGLPSSLPEMVEPSSDTFAESAESATLPAEEIVGSCVSDASVRFATAVVELTTNGAAPVAAV